MDLDDEIEPRWEAPDCDSNSDEEENVESVENVSGKRRRDILMRAVLDNCED